MDMSFAALMPDILGFEPPLPGIHTLRGHSCMTYMPFTALLSGMFAVHGPAARSTDLDGCCLMVFASGSAMCAIDCMRAILWWLVILTIASRDLSLLHTTPFVCRLGGTRCANGVRG